MRIEARADNRNLRRPSLLFFFALFSLSNCVTPGEPKLDNIAPPTSTKPAEPIARLSCETDIFDDDCKTSDMDVKTMCFTDQIDNTLLFEGHNARGWGSNKCFAMADFVRRSCVSDLNVNKIYNVHCVPDPTEGRCPAEAVDCPNNDAQEPTLCLAHEYNQMPLAASAKVGAWGSTECEARKLLAQQSCAQGLSPAYLGAIKCEAAYHPEVCPPKRPKCDSKSEPTWCRASLGSNPALAPMKLTVYGRNKCEAQYEFAKKSCMLGYRVDRFKDWQCKPGGS